MIEMGSYIKVMKGELKGNVYQVTYVSEGFVSGRVLDNDIEIRFSLQDVVPADENDFNATNEERLMSQINWED